MFAGSEKVATFASAFETKRPVLSKTALLALRAILRMKCRRFRSNAKFLKKKLQKSFGVSKIFFTFATAFEKNENGSSIGREFATNGLPTNDAESWIDARFLKKKLQKSLQVQKTCLTFAIPFTP